MVYLAYGGFWLTFGRIGAMILGLGLSIAFANLLDPNQYGTYSYIITTMGIVSAFSLSGLPNALLQAAARKERGILGVSFFYHLRWSGAVVVLSWLLAGYYLYRSDELFATAFFLVGLLSPLLHAFNLYLPYLNGIRAYKKTARYNILSSLLLTGTMVGALFLTSNVALLVLTFLGTSVSIAATLFLLTKVTHDRGELSLQEKLRLYSFSKHLSVMKILSSTTTQLDKIFVFHFLGAAELALYAFIVLVPNQFRSLLKNAYDLLVPKYATQNYKSISSSLVSKVLLLGGLTSVFVIIYLTIAPYIYQLLFPVYVDAIPYSQVYAFTLFGILAMFPNAALTTQESKKELYLFNGITAVTRPTILFFGIFFWGLWGAVLAQLVLKSLHLSLQYAFFWSAVKKDRLQN